MNKNFLFLILIFFVCPCFSFIKNINRLTFFSCSFVLPYYMHKKLDNYVYKPNSLTIYWTNLKKEKRKQLHYNFYIKHANLTWQELFQQVLKNVQEPDKDSTQMDCALNALRIKLKHSLILSEDIEFEILLNVLASAIKNNREDVIQMIKEHHINCLMVNLRAVTDVRLNQKRLQCNNILLFLLNKNSSDIATKLKLLKFINQTGQINFTYNDIKLIETFLNKYPEKKADLESLLKVVKKYMAKNYNIIANKREPNNFLQKRFLEELN